MDQEKILSLSQCFRSSNQSLLSMASNELLVLYSNPDSIPLLLSMFLEYDDDFIRKNLLIGLDKALTDNNINKLSPEKLSIVQDMFVNLVFSLTDDQAFDDISNPLFFLYHKTGMWPSLQQYISTGDYTKTRYFLILNHVVSKDINNEDSVEQMIEFVTPRLQQNLASNQSLENFFTLLCFISSLAVKSKNRDFLFDFVDFFKNALHELLQNLESKFFANYLEVLRYLIAGGYLDFIENVCPLPNLLQLSLNPDLDYAKSMTIRSFFNETLDLCNYDSKTILQFLEMIVQLSIKFYSTEVDIQTQQIDDYFKFFKLLSIEECQEFSNTKIQQLLQLNSIPSICTAMSIYQGAIIRGAIFENVLNLFIQCYSIDNNDIKMIVISTLSDVSEEISVQIEQHSTTLFSMFSQHLQELTSVSPQLREQPVMSIFDAFKTIIDCCPELSDQTSISLMNILALYVQNGTGIEQVQALMNIYLIIEKNDKVATLPTTFSLILQPITSHFAEFRNLSYNFLILYVTRYPRFIETQLNMIILSISNENDFECFGLICSLLSAISISFKTPQIREFIISKLNLFVDVCNCNAEANFVLYQSKGIVIGSLLGIMISYPDLVESLFPHAVKGIVDLIETENINQFGRIVKGFNFLSSEYIKIDPNSLIPIFDAISRKLNEKSNPESEYYDGIFILLTDFYNYLEKMPCLCDILVVGVKTFLYQAQHEKKYIDRIGFSSAFIRTVFQNISTDPIKLIAQQCFPSLLEMLESNLYLPSIENHIILVISSIIEGNSDAIPDSYQQPLMYILMKIMQSATMCTTKSIVYLIKCLAEEKPAFLQSNVIIIFQYLVNILSLHSNNPMILQMNDLIISTLISLEENIVFMSLNEFFHVISPYLPIYSDTMEMSYVYTFLLVNFNSMNVENQTRFIESNIILLSKLQINQVLNNYLQIEEVVGIFNTIKAKLDSIEDSQSYIDQLLSSDEEKRAFLKNFNYIIGCAQQLAQQQVSQQNSE
ncbi:hypothetical protein TRFO_27293 [Tritrichomonas foetus]|uniref:Importin N-terminal domain-containing protein n=1 Tax=Tritrichomonas foetus TaxID=1144522 RepID=A0A1J4K2S6_9EUKA|nr:hypothetical protein TRFO_27293 [Tritrichomonas foetus]|eukprot:OHT05112.1 hypothetical protein TRFO_27293 [Tritrichomonas foetus]